MSNHVYFFWISHLLSLITWRILLSKKENQKYLIIMRLVNHDDNKVVGAVFLSRIMYEFDAKHSNTITNLRSRTDPDIFRHQRRHHEKLTGFLPKIIMWIGDISVNLQKKMSSWRIRFHDKVTFINILSYFVLGLIYVYGVISGFAH